MEKDKQTTKKLSRSSSDKVIGGVAAGIGEYFKVDPVLIRIAFVIIAVSTLGTASVLYLGMWLIIPTEVGVNMKTSDSIKENAEEISAKAEKLVSKVKAKTGTMDNGNSNNVLGLIIVLIGVFLLFSQLGLFKAVAWVFNLWPLLLIALGFSIMTRK